MTKRQRLAALRRMMRQHRLTSVDVAVATSYKPQTVRAWCAGIRSTPQAAIDALCMWYPERQS